MSTSLFLLIINGLLAFFLVFIGSRFSRLLQTGKNEARRIRILQEKIRAALLDDGFGHENFASTLAATAGMTTKLQETRLNYQANHNQQAPEKYKIVLQLASQGMAAEEIARIIAISTTEARQLLSLSNLAADRS